MRNALKELSASDLPTAISIMLLLCLAATSVSAATSLIDPLLEATASFTLPNSPSSQKDVCAFSLEKKDDLGKPVCKTLILAPDADIHVSGGTRRVHVGLAKAVMLHEISNSSVCQAKVRRGGYIRTVRDVEEEEGKTEEEEEEKEEEEEEEEEETKRCWNWLLCIGNAEPKDTLALFPNLIPVGQAFVPPLLVHGLFELIPPPPSKSGNTIFTRELSSWVLGGLRVLVA